MPRRPLAVLLLPPLPLLLTPAVAAPPPDPPPDWVFPKWESAAAADGDGEAVGGGEEGDAAGTAGDAAPAAPAADAPFPPLRAQHDVQLIGSLPSDEFCLPGRLPFVTQQGKAYTCCLRQPNAAMPPREEQPPPQQPSAAAAAAKAADAAPTAEELAAQREELLKSSDVAGVEDAVAAGLKGKGCVVWATNGWWAYELCAGKWVRQYHEDDGTVLSEYVLGIGRHALALDAAGNRKVKYPDGMYSVTSKLKKLDPPEATGKWTFGTEPRADADDGSGPRVFLTTTYLNGLACDDGPRETEVRVYCAEWEQELAFNVTEERPCRYVARLWLREVCKLDAYRVAAGKIRPAGAAAAAGAGAATDDDALARLPAVERQAKMEVRRKSIEQSDNVPGVPDVLRRGLDGKSCVAWYTDGWWAYEMCADHWVRQYHEDDGIVHSEFFLGLGKNALDTDRTTGRKVKYKDGEQTVLRKLRASHDTPTADGRWVVGREGAGADDMHGANGRYYFSTRFGDGLRCDLTKRPRETEVRLYCLEDGRDVVFNVSEVATCRYVGRVFLKSVCSFEPYRHLIAAEPVPKQTTPAATILCAETPDAAPARAAAAATGCAAGGDDGDGERCAAADAAGGDGDAGGGEAKEQQQQQQQQEEEPAGGEGGPAAQRNSVLPLVLDPGAPPFRAAAVIGRDGRGV